MAASTQIFLFSGTDEARVAEAAMAATRRLTPPDAGDFGQEIIDGQADNAEMAENAVFSTIQALQTLPFFGGGKVVWLRNATFLGDTVTGKAEATVAAVQRLIQVLEPGLAADVNFVLSAPTIHKSRYKKLHELAKLEEFNKVDISRSGWEGKLAPLVQQRAKQAGLTFDRATAQHFIVLVGEDTRRLDSELEKLRTYCGSHSTVTLDDIRAVVSKSRGGIVFEIGNAIGKRDLPESLSLLEHFLDLGENPVGIIRAGIIPQVRNLLVMSDMMARHRLPTGNYDAFKGALERLPEAETAHLPRSKSGEISPYPLFLACGAASNYRPRELIDAMDACVEADRCLVNTGMDAALVLSQLLVKILAARKNAA